MSLGTEGAIRTNVTKCSYLNKDIKTRNEYKQFELYAIVTSVNGPPTHTWKLQKAIDITRIIKIPVKVCNVFQCVLIMKLNDTYPTNTQTSFLDLLLIQSTCLGRESKGRLCVLLMVYAFILF